MRSALPPCRAKSLTNCSPLSRNLYLSLLLTNLWFDEADASALVHVLNIINALVNIFNAFCQGMGPWKRAIFQSLKRNGHNLACPLKTEQAKWICVEHLSFFSIGSRKICVNFHDSLKKAVKWALFQYKRYHVPRKIELFLWINHVNSQFFAEWL